MQTKFLHREYWLPLLAAVVFLAGGSCAFAQESPKAETCSSDICFIKVTHDGFLPERLVVRDGSTVIWKNVDREGAHMIAGGTDKNHALFNSSLLSSGRDYSFVFNGGRIGRFTYIDQGIDNMVGEITVVPSIPENNLKSLAMDLADPGSGLTIVMERGNVTAATATPRLHKVTL